MNKKEFCLPISERVLENQAIQVSSIQVSNNIMNMLESVLNILWRNNFDDQLCLPLRKSISWFLKIDI